MALERLMPPKSEDAPKDAREGERKSMSGARGALGNTGLGEKLAGKALDASRDPQNTYAGSNADTLEKDSKHAAESYPKTNRISSEAIATPLAAAGAELLPAAGLAGRALAQGALGAAHGAYTAPQGQDRVRNAALGAAAGAGAPLAQGAAQALGTRLGAMMPPPPPPPALATANAPTVPAMPSAMQSAAREAQSPAATGIMRRVPGTGPNMPGPAAVRGMPTVPPAAAPEAAEQLLRSERDRRIMRPPSTDEALDESAISGLPHDAPLPVESKYRVNNGPIDLDKPENWSEYALRGLENDGHAAQARGGVPEIQPRGGQSMFNADQAKPSRSMLPTLPPDYVPTPRATKPYSPADSIQNELNTVVPSAGPPLRLDLGSIEPPPRVLSDAPTIMPGPLESRVPPAQKPLVSESMIPEAERTAKYADVVHGNEMLKRKSPADAEKLYVESRDRLKGVSPRANEADYAEKPKTVRPGKKAKKQ